MKEAASGCSDAVCGIVENFEEMPGKGNYKKLLVDVGMKDLLVIVTDWEVVNGMRCVIAMLGSFVGDDEVTEKKMGGVVSQGALCDGFMLGWTGADKGSAARLPTTFAFEPGDGAPPDKPRRAAEGDAEIGEVIFDLADMKMTKEEKKAAREKKKADKAKAERIARGEPEPVAKKKKLKKPTKKDLKTIKKKISTKRGNGDEVETDDELAAAGFLPEGVSEEDTDEDE
jgi:tRNA-binding EMAP/Myf-like protein